LAELRGEIESRTAEVESVRARLTDVENSWAKSREEADAFRALTTGSLGELLDSHRDLKTDESFHSWACREGPSTGGRIGVTAKDAEGDCTASGGTSETTDRRTIACAGAGN